MSGKPQDKNAGSVRRRPKLIVAENGHQKVLEIGQKITTLGRSHENTVEIDDISSSRQHCQIERKEGGYEIVDLKSRNGTVVNGVLVLRKELRPGDCIEIGKTQIFFILFYQVGGLSDSEAGTAAAAFTLGGLVGTIAGGFAVRCTSHLCRAKPRLCT